jgi:hypothetical protein
VSVRSRVAFATGVAGIAGATLTLSGRFDAGVGLVLLFALAAQAGASGASIDTGPAFAAEAGRDLARQARLAPAWAIVVSTGALRAGSASIADVRGANAVAGLALARGPVVTVAGAWLAVAAGAVAIVASMGSSTVRGAAAPAALRRLEGAGVFALAAILVTLFAGPQVRGATDAVAWVAGIAALSALAWRARTLDLPDLSLVAFALAAAGLGLTLAGGAP